MENGGTINPEEIFEVAKKSKKSKKKQKIFFLSSIRGDISGAGNCSSCLQEIP